MCMSREEKKFFLQDRQGDNRDPARGPANSDGNKKQEPSVNLKPSVTFLESEGKSAGKTEGEYKNKKEYNKNTNEEIKAREKVLSLVSEGDSKIQTGSDGERKGKFFLVQEKKKII